MKQPTNDTASADRTDPDDVITRVNPSNRRRLILSTLLPLAGISVGLVFALLVEAVASVTAFGGIFGVASYLGEPRALIIGAALGLVGGLIALGGVLGEAMRATVSDRQITIAWDQARVVVPRHLVTNVVVSHDLVLLAKGGVELARMPMRLSTAGLVRALDRHQYPKPITSDPSDEAFTAWDPSDDQLEDSMHRLLDARAMTVRAGARGDAEMLRRQLARRGVMVRDVRHQRRSHQQWRLTRSRLANSDSLMVTASPAPALAD